MKSSRFMPFVGRVELASALQALSQPKDRHSRQQVGIDANDFRVLCAGSQDSESEIIVVVRAPT